MCVCLIGDGLTGRLVSSLSPDVFDLSLTDSCLQEGEETTTENGINPELAKVGSKKTASSCCTSETLIFHCLV